MNGDAQRLRSAVEAALRGVVDPELGIDVVSLGLVYHASVDEGEARLVYTLTSPACPLGSVIERDIRSALLRVDGIDRVEARLVFEPPWSPSRMQPEARERLGVCEARDGAPGAPEDFPLFSDEDDRLWQPRLAPGES